MFPLARHFIPYWSSYSSHRRRQRSVVLPVPDTSLDRSFWFSQIGYKAQKHRNWGSATSGNCCHTTQLRVIHFLHLTLTFVRMLADIVSNGLLLQFDCRSVPTVKLQWSCTCRVLATYSTCLLQNFFFLCCHTTSAHS